MGLPFAWLVILIGAVVQGWPGKKPTRIGNDVLLPNNLPSKGVLLSTDFPQTSFLFLPKLISFYFLGFWVSPFSFNLSLWFLRLLLCNWRKNPWIFPQTYWHIYGCASNQWDNLQKSKVLSFWVLNFFFEMSRKTIIKKSLTLAIDTW